MTLRRESMLGMARGLAESSGWVAFFAIGIVFAVIGSGTRRRRAIQAERENPN